MQFLLRLPCMPKLMRFSGKLSGTSYVVGYLWKQHSFEILCKEVSKVNLPNSVTYLNRLSIFEWI